EIALARAAAQGGVQLADVKSLRRVADDASLAPQLSARTRRYLIEIYTAAGAPDKALAVARAGDLGMASYVESFKAAKGTAKSINLYDLALLTDLTRLYRELARRQLEQAAAHAQCSKVLARVGQVTEAGDGRRYQRLNFALGSYYLRKKDYARAISYMEAGRDKSNKNKIEANDPEMLAGLAEAYYRTKKFSEGLEIFFEMSKEFPVVRQIQEAMQGVYSMEQRSAGDVKIL